MLRLYDVGGKLFNRIKSIYVNTLACVGVTGCESECFRIDRGVRRGFIISLGSSMCIYGCSDEKGENGDREEEMRFLEEGRDWR